MHSATHGFATTTESGFLARNLRACRQAPILKSLAPRASNVTLTLARSVRDHEPPKRAKALTPTRRLH
ncbi:hypothetical protein C8F04DRAFT_1254354 [Mycena alexandri]|uniref:Uncharacterized protein n=1 Tax=Mycena alexandri TaxID=1745969 RepID=A0AAD6T875_9AGAR|nr:hypothetical protein C8F04DRAFT_1254354 [Mycena alexandri]